jgi:tripartite-type tricarboxylate transporter receptor subunit TctC
MTSVQKVSKRQEETHWCQFPSVYGYYQVRQWLRVTVRNTWRHAETQYMPCQGSAAGRADKLTPSAWACLDVAGGCGAVFLTLLLMLVGVPAVAAEPEFFAGKTVTILVGFGPGGGYDLYARTLARHMGHHIPGNPTIVVQNMAGAGSLRVVNYLYNAAPKNGSVIATFARGIVLEPMFGRSEGVQFNPVYLGWLGSISNETSVCAFMAESGIKSWQDMQTKNYTIGASDSGADSDVFPQALRNLFHLPLRIVTGYSGGAEMVLAMQRHEIDGRCGWSWTSLLSRNRSLYDSKQIDVPVQLTLSRYEDLRDVPSIMDLATDAQQRAVLRLIISRQVMARPFAAPPDVPRERLRVLRDAFDTTMRDPEFLEEAKRLDLEVRPVTGAEIEALVNEVLASPPDIVSRAAEAITDTPKH